MSIYGNLYKLADTSDLEYLVYVYIPIEHTKYRACVN